jgi:hypothetical protein
MLHRKRTPITYLLSEVGQSWNLKMVYLSIWNLPDRGEEGEDAHGVNSLLTSVPRALLAQFCDHLSKDKTDLVRS